MLSTQVLLVFNKSNLYKLTYFNTFDRDMIKMTQLKFDTSVFPKKGSRLF